MSQKTSWQLRPYFSITAALDILLKNEHLFLQSEDDRTAPFNQKRHKSAKTEQCHYVVSPWLHDHTEHTVVSRINGKTRIHFLKILPIKYRNIIFLVSWFYGCLFSLTVHFGFCLTKVLLQWQKKNHYFIFITFTKFRNLCVSLHQHFLIVWQIYDKFLNL